MGLNFKGFTTINGKPSSIVFKILNLINKYVSKAMRHKK